MICVRLSTTFYKALSCDCRTTSTARSVIGKTDSIGWSTSRSLESPILLADQSEECDPSLSRGQRRSTTFTRLAGSSDAARPSLESHDFKQSTTSHLYDLLFIVPLCRSPSSNEYVE
jgi:hypothetical protein